MPHVTDRTPRLASRIVSAPPVTLDLLADPVSLTAALVDVPSVSGQEGALADAVQVALATQAPHLELLRSGHAVLARTRLGRARRVLLAGHLDTVPIADNVPSRREGGTLYGCGTSDMKSGVAVMTHLAAALAEPAHDVTLVLYDCEEVEAGCQGTLRVVVRTHGRRAHSARSWLGENAIHAAAPVLARLEAYAAREVDIDGCRYREGLQAVRIAGGVAGNVVPDECVVGVNFRFAPDRDAEAAERHVREVFDGFEVAVTDLAPGALPGLAAPAAQEFLAATGARPAAKYGWTDVARFAALGIPALNYGPGDPNLAHTRDEHVEPHKITE